MTYATDGRCHNAEAGTFNHECGRPAAWIGRYPKGYESGFCDECKAHGREARGVVRWTPVEGEIKDETGRAIGRLTFAHGAWLARSTHNGESMGSFADRMDAANWLHAVHDNRRGVRPPLYLSSTNV